MTSDCGFIEADHPRYPHGQFAPKRNDAPTAQLAAPPPPLVEIFSSFLDEHGEGYSIQSGPKGFRWAWTEMDDTETSEWFATEGEAIIAAADDWKANGTSSPSMWAHDLQKAADAERAEHDRAEVAERRAIAARLRRTGRGTPARSGGSIAKEAAALVRDARLVGEGAVDDLKGYAGAVFD